jgi:exopolyphosphatase/guanosine-5'-triphosphate,3'-diphosphate pyrophosphatase
LIANIARYHRKSHPKLKHENLQKLPQDKRGIMSFLAAILRIAEGLDRRQTALVRDISLAIEEKKITVYVHPQSSQHIPDVELWGAERRKSLLEDITNRAVTFIATD